MTWHVCVYHRVTGNSIYNFEEKANRKMDKEKKHTTWKQRIMVHRCQRGGEKKRSGKGGRQEEETRDGRSTSREKNGRMEDVHLYTAHIV